jgi:hypothetical protein
VQLVGSERMYILDSRTGAQYCAASWKSENVYIGQSHRSTTLNFLISNFSRVLNVVFFLLGVWVYLRTSPT